jgi:hypothetical protein
LGGGSEHLEVVVGGRAEAIWPSCLVAHATRIRRKIKIFGVHPGTVKAGLRSHHVSCDALEFGEGHEVVDERNSRCQYKIRCGRSEIYIGKGMEVNVT